MRVNIENACKRGNASTHQWVLEELVRNLKELRDRSAAGDSEAALREFFALFVFNDNQDTPA